MDQFFKFWVMIVLFNQLKFRVELVFLVFLNLRAKRLADGSTDFKYFVEASTKIRMFWTA
ncbi:MAG TPA: hypothetical protein DCS60_04950 [Opitutae bacterium]|nr:hypothetical protein [Opitutae bacterium]